MYYGDFAEDATVYIPFNTFTSDDPSASCTITDLVAGDIKIHKNGHIDQKASADGITVTINFDGITGNHLVTIDTSNDTGAAGFWVTGSEISVRIEGTTVDGATINAWIGTFSIERAGGVLALLKTLITTVGAAGVGLAEAGGDGDQLTGINLPNQTMDITGNLSGSVGSVTGHTVQTADHTAALTAIAGYLDTEIAAIKAVTDVETGVKAAVNALHNLSAANINAEVVDVLKTDTLGEPGQGAPGATLSIEAKIAWMFKFMRNLITNDGSFIKVFNDAGAVVDHKAPVSEAAGTVTRGEFVTGP